jgi:hypothetical protein
MILKQFSIAYLPPIDYLLEMKNSDEIFVETQEKYQKQTYRNRATILTGNGLHDLIIPVVRNPSIAIKDIRLDNSMAWQHSHWKTIESAYNNSPFFLYYRDFFEPFYKTKYVFLFDFDVELLYLLRKLFAITNSISFTGEFKKNIKDCADFRNYFLPKSRLFRPQKIEYLQVFFDRYPFEQNIACIDYLFTTGCNFS